jgi:excisionase family DNA binding protein
MNMAGRITVAQIAARLSIGRAAVYQALEERIIPAIRLGRRWIITRQAFEEWERRCGQERTFSMDATGSTA